MSRKAVMLLMAVLFNAVTGALFATAADFSPGIGAVGMNTVGAFMRTYGDTTPVLCAGVYAEVWTGEPVKVLCNGLVDSWLDGVPDQSSIVNNDVIRLVEVGMDPDVLINDTTYPVPMQALEDKDIAIPFDEFQSKVTPIANDELYAISYDKMTRVKESHGNTISDAEFAKAAHVLCAIEYTVKTPVLETTGDADEGTGHKHLTPNNLVEMKHALDKPKAPSENHRLVPCPDHVGNLLLMSQNFHRQYSIDHDTGKADNLYGFQVYEYGNNPVYTTAGKKKAVGAASDIGEFQCSFAFYTPRVSKITGSMKMYFSETQKDPEYQRSKISFRYYFICMLKKADTDVMMMSGYAASGLPEG